MEQLLLGIELVNGNCADVLPGLPPADLILTSPPYDNLREYGGYNGAFDFDAIAAACVANLAPRGVLVWVGRDAVIDGSETCASFRQAIHFRELGLNLHQTGVYQHWTVAGMRRNAYYRNFDYMLVFSKGSPKTANLLSDSKHNRPIRKDAKKTQEGLVTITTGNFVYSIVHQRLAGGGLYGNTTPGKHPVIKTAICLLRNWRDTRRYFRRNLPVTIS